MLQGQCNKNIALMKKKKKPNTSIHVKENKPGTEPNKYKQHQQKPKKAHFSKALIH